LGLKKHKHISLSMNKLWKISLIVFVLVFLIQISLVSAATYYNGLYIGNYDVSSIMTTPRGVCK